MKRRSGDSEPVNSRDPRNRGSVPQPTFNSKFFTSNLDVFNRNFPEFQLPRAVGFFSLDVHRNYHNDYSQLRYLSLGSQSSIWTGNRTCRVNFDLTKGIDKLEEKDVKDEEEMQAKMLDDLLTWIDQERKAKNPNIVNIADPLLPLNIDFVCFRGLLTLLVTTPYEKKEGWTLVASRHGNTIYMFQLKDPSKNWNANIPRLKDMALWGFKFEQYLCVDTPGAQPNPDEKLNTNPEFCCVIKTKLAKHSLLYGAEIDALKSGHSKPPWDTLENFVELKTTRLIETTRHEFTFRKHKSLKWWAQSFLVGIPTIICGYRDDYGIVRQLEAIDVRQLRKDCDDYWKSNICMNFCQQFLDYVKNSIPTDESPKVNYLFEYSPSLQVITCSKDTSGRCSRKLIPDWYLELLEIPIDQ